MAPGEALSARIILKNLGYASLYNPRLVELVLKNTQNNEIYKVRLDIEPRLWKPLVENAIEAVVGIPQELPLGEYKLYLNLPDPEETLYANPDYSIRIANTDMWEESTGYNYLGINIQIQTKNAITPYTGDLRFEKAL